MEPSRFPWSEGRSELALAPVAELVLQNSRLRGTRRELGQPLTFIGRAAGCDIRLNVEGIASFHCLLVQDAQGVMLRDLDTVQGTFVNGQRQASTQLRDGDLLAVGPFQFRLHLPAGATDPLAEEKARLEEAYAAEAAVQQQTQRIQIAALVAQQAALHEEEARLQQQRATLEHQQEQLAAHLEEKQQRLAQLTERAQAEQAALESDRTVLEKHIEQRSGELNKQQRQLAENQQKVLVKRRRLAMLYRQLRQRWQQFQHTQGQKIKAVEAELTQRGNTLEKTAQRLRDQEKALADKQAQVKSDTSKEYNQIKNAWAELRQAQEQWRRRRRKEHAVLRFRARQMDQAELHLNQVRHQHQLDVERWQKHRLRLDQEMEGLETRILHLRHKALAQQQELTRLETQLCERQNQLTPAGDAAPPPAQAETKQQEPRHSLATLPPAWQHYASDLQRVAGELADQRAELAEQWQRLLQSQENLQQQRDQAAGDLETLAGKLQHQEQSLAQREQALTQVEAVWQRRYEELNQLRQHLAAWRAKLRTRETSWEGERQRLLADLQAREEVANHHLNVLVDLRQRWLDRRQRELALLQADRDACTQLRQELAARKQEWAARLAQLEDDRRQHTEQMLALEQFRQECLAGQPDLPATHRRLERLRRRWITQNANALRSLQQERDALREMLSHLDGQYAELEKRARDLTTTEGHLAEEQTAWEHKQVLANARQERMQQELQSLQARHASAEDQLRRLKEEMDRLAQTTGEEPEFPPLLLDKAA